MGRHWKTLCVCTALWTTAFALAAGGSARGDLRLMLWAVIVALTACMVTGWLVATCAATKAAADERLRLEELATIMAEAMCEERDVPRIHS